MLKQRKLSELKNQDKVEHFLLLTSISLKSTKTGKNYLDMELRDETIALNAKMWSGFESVYETLESGTVVKILGSVDEFNNQPQIRIDRIRNTVENDNVTVEDFLPKSKRNLADQGC